MPAKRAWFGAAALPNGTIYVVGGLTYLGEAPAPQIPPILLDANEEYQVSTNSWRIRAPLPTARALLGAAAVNGKIYAIGGESDAGTVASVDEYDPLTDTWRPRAPMLTARTHHGVAVSGGKIYAIGGFYADTVEAYDPLTDT